MRIYQPSDSYMAECLLSDETIQNQKNINEGLRNANGKKIVARSP